METLQSGDIAPGFILPDDSGADFGLCADHVAGQLLAIVFCPNGIAEATGEIEGFAKHYEAFSQLGAEVIGVSQDPTSLLAEYRDRFALPFPLLSDIEGAVFRAYGIPGSEEIAESRTVTVLLRPNRHVLHVVHDSSQTDTALRLFTKHRRVQRVNALSNQAPVLVIPDVLTSEDCQRLITLYRHGDAPWVELHEAMTIDHDVKSRVPDYGRRDRIDHFIRNRETQDYIAGRLQARLLPEVKKVFQYDVTSFEGLRIGCYEGKRQGKLHGHRDDSFPEVAHRRFAVSINLDSDSFEGGELWFPEYSTQRYKPETGAALVFSCSLLHEALEVSHGQRLVLLVFLFGEH